MEGFSFQILCVHVPMSVCVVHDDLVFGSGGSLRLCMGIDGV